MKLDAIKKENIVYDPFEYILIENFIEGLDDPKVFDDYINNYSIIDEHDLLVGSEHPVQISLDLNRKIILQKVNETWDLNIADILLSMNLFTKKEHSLPIHNDVHKMETIPVRGILYCNPQKVFGTTMHISDQPSDGIIKEVGGNPGDLLLFKVSENSWHGVMTKKDTDINRLTCNIFFTTRQDGTF